MTPKDREARLMTDELLVGRKLTQIEIYVEELRTLARPEEIRQNIVEQRFVVFTLYIAIQAAINVAAHIVADQKLGLPGSNRGCFLLLGVKGWLPEDLAGRLARMAQFRNVLIYQNSEVDLGKVEEILRDHLGDLLAFVAAIRQRLSGPTGREIPAQG
jgi:uncharacterized protein YutE (UPF0331/DUF86 family)